VEGEQKISPLPEKLLAWSLAQAIQAIAYSCGSVHPASPLLKLMHVTCLAANCLCVNSNTAMHAKELAVFHKSWVSLY